MWQANKSKDGKVRVGFQIPIHRQDEFNSYVKDLQNDLSQEFSSGLDLIDALINIRKQLTIENEQLTESNKALTLELEEKNNAPEITPENQEKLDNIQTKFEDIRGKLFEDAEMSELQMLEALEEMVTFHSEPQEVVKEVEKVVEVEKPLAENQLILSLSEREEKIVNHISLYRFKKGRDKEQLTKGQVIKRLAFNDASIVNWGGEFETGINSERKFGK